MKIYKVEYLLDTGYDKRFCSKIIIDNKTLTEEEIKKLLYQKVHTDNDDIIEKILISDVSNDKKPLVL